MRKISRTFKRSIAALLAVVMVMTTGQFGLVFGASAHEVEHNHEHVALGQLIVRNYGDEGDEADEDALLSEEEEAVILTGALAGDKSYAYVLPPETVADEDGLIVVDEDNKTVTVKSYIDKEENEWLPVSFDLMYSGAVIEEHDDLALVWSDEAEAYVGSYTYEENTFSVVVTYELSIEEEKAAQLALMNAADALAKDIDYMLMLDSDICYAITSSGITVELTALEVLEYLTSEDIPGLDGTAIGMIYELSLGYSMDLGNGITITTPGFSPKDKNAAKGLYQETKTEGNNGQLDLVDFFADYDVSYLEILLGAVYDDEGNLTVDYYNELKEALASNYEAIEKVINGLEDTLYYLESTDEEYGLAYDVRQQVYSTLNNELATYADTLAALSIELPVIESDEDVADAIKILQDFYDGQLNTLNENLKKCCELCSVEYDEAQHKVTSSANMVSVIETVEQIVYTEIEKQSGYPVAGTQDVAELLAKVENDAILYEQIDAQWQDVDADLKALLVSDYGAPAEVASADDLAALKTALTNLENAILDGITTQLQTLHAANPMLAVVGVPTAVQSKAELDALIQNYGTYLAADATTYGYLTTAQGNLAALEAVVGAIEEAEKQWAAQKSAISELLGQASTGLAALETAKAQQPNMVMLETAIEKLGGVQTQLETLNDTVAAASKTYVDQLNMLIGLLEKLLETMMPVYNRFNNNEWNVLNDELVAKDAVSDDYTALTDAVLALFEVDVNGKPTDPATKIYNDSDVETTLYVTSSTVQYNMSMYNVTVKVNAQVMNGTAAENLDEYSVTVTLRAGATEKEVQDVVDAAVVDALDKWEVIDGHYVKSADELSIDEEGLSADLTYHVSYAPEMISVTTEGDYGVNAQYPYGYVLTLPVHGITGMAYSYEVNGARMNQGKTVTIVEPLTISRTEGTADQYRTITDLIQNTDVATDAEKDFLNSSALGKGEQFWLAIPSDEDGLISLDNLKSDKQITADTFPAELDELEWVPVSAITYSASGAVIETVYFTNGVAVVESTGFETVEVTYELTLTTAALAEVGIDSDEIVLQLNLRDTLIEEYAQQKEALELLLTQRNNLAKIGEKKTDLGNAVMAASTNEAKLLINQAIEQMESNGGQLVLYTLLMQVDTDNDGVVDNMLAYYENADAFAEQIDFVLDMTDAISNDGNLWSVLGSYAGYQDMFLNLQKQINEMELPGVNAAIDVESDSLSALLDSMGDALEAGYAVDGEAAYTAADLADGMIWTAAVEAEGLETVTQNFTVYYDVAGEKSTVAVRLQVDVELTEENITAIENALAGLKSAYVSKYGAVAETFYDKTVTMPVKGNVLAGGETFGETLTLKSYTVKVEGVEKDQTVTYADRVITLPGSGTTATRYEYNVAGKTVNVYADDQTYTFSQAEFAAIFATDTLTVTREEIDVAVEEQAKEEEKLENLVGSMGGAILGEQAGEDGGYVIMVPAETLTGFVTGLVMDTTYDDVYLDVNGKSQVFKDTLDDGVSVQYHLQTLLDLILHSGMGTESILDMFDAQTGAVVPNLSMTETEDGYIFTEANAPMVMTADDEGMTTEPVNLNTLLKTVITLDGIQADFYITVSDDTLKALRDYLVQALERGVTILCDDGKLQVIAGVPDQFYAAYLAALSMVGEVDIHDLESVDNEVALGYIMDLLEPVLGSESEVTIDTIVNTLSVFGQDLDPDTIVFAYEDVLSMTYADVFDYLAKAYSKLVVDESGASITLNDIAIDGLVAKLQPMVDKMVAEMGVEGISINLADMIYECDDPDESNEADGGTDVVGLDITISAKLANTDTDYDALFVDMGAEGAMNKFGMWTGDELVAGAAGLSGTSMVILLSDVDLTSVNDKGQAVIGTLTINGTTILDLNGKTVTGNITGSNLTIIDSANQDGTVTGAISGNVTILGGKYIADVTANLSEGYQQVEGVVSNKLFTITEDDKNNITVTLNATPAEIEELISKQGLTDLAIEIVTDLVVNHYNMAALSIDGLKVYDLQLNDLVSLVAGTERMDNAIDTILGCISAPNLAELVNTVIEDLTDFAALESALNGDGVIVKYTTATAQWVLELEHVTADDSLTANLGAAKEPETGSLTIVVEGSLKDELATLAGALADTSTVDLGNLKLDEIVRNPNDEIVVNGSYTGSIELDFSKDANYVIMMAVILADGADASLKAQLVADIEAYYERGDLTKLEETFQALTVKQICDALRTHGTAERFDAIVDGLALKAETKTKIKAAIDNTETGYALAIDAIGFVLRQLDNQGQLESVTGSGRTLGSLGKKDADGNTYYGFGPTGKTFSGTRTLASTYSLNYDLSINDVTVTVYLFKQHVHEMEKHDAVEATCTTEGNIEYWECTVCGKLFADEAGTKEITEAETVIAIDETKHDYVYIKTVQPTVDSEGYDLYECKHNSEHRYTTNVKAKLPTVGVPTMTVGGDIFGFKVDTRAGIIYVDTVKDGLPISNFKTLLAAVVRNDADGKADIVISNGINGLIRTGSEVTVTAENKDGKQAVGTYKVVVIGDVNCNGRIESGDCTKINRHYVGAATLTGLQFLAADTNCNGRLEAGDVVKVRVKYLDSANYTTALK